MKPRTTKGYIAILTVLTLLVLSLSLLLTLPYLSLDGSKQSLTSFQGEQVLAALEACAEDTLLGILRSDDYTGGVKDYFGIRCDVSVEKEGSVWQLSLLANKENTMFRTLRVEIDRTPGDPTLLSLTRWLEE